VNAVEHRTGEPSEAQPPSTGILLVDGTGRGHALCGLFVRTDPAVTVYYGPGCDVIDHPRVRCVPSISVHDSRTVLDFLDEHPVEFVFVSHIDALSAGLVDELRAAGHKVIGPTAAAAALEASKARGKRFCVDHGIPVPEHAVLPDIVEAKAYIRSRPYPCVVKADGLTADGDGSVVCDTGEEAEAAAERLAAAGLLPLVVEERLTGPEISVFALVDGTGAMLLPPAIDFKRTLDGDKGKNCDGMGSIAPHPSDSPELREILRSELVEPFVRGVRAEGLDFTGFVYLGAVLTARGPVVIEINARFGDSEAQVVLPGLRENFTDLCRAVLAGALDRRDARHDGRTRCSVALVQGHVPGTDPEVCPGWPFGAFVAGQPVSGLRPSDEMTHVFYANIRRDETGRPVTSGGRVLHVVGSGETLAGAREAAYREVARIDFPGVRYRGDIGAAPPPAWPGEAVRRPGDDDAEQVIAAESAVRSYVRSFPAVFETASGDHLVARDGTRYLDFLAGAGSLNYGHNPEFIKRELIEYLEGDGLTHGLDLATTVKREFLATLQSHILQPRGMDYHVQFCSPSGTNAVEASMKLARLVTGRMSVVAFSGAFHGVSSGSLGATSAAHFKEGLYHSLGGVTHIPYPSSPFGPFDSLDLLDRLVRDPSAGGEKPAAVIVETIQAEGGVYVAPRDFLVGLRAWCDANDVLMIVDDIQVGCGRTGTFFSFERAGIVPDLVTLSKSISGYGLPMAILLIKPDHDLWQPGQHSGTFRGNQLAFIGATAALRKYWSAEAAPRFTAEIEDKGEVVARRLDDLVPRYGASLRGTGLIWGLDLTGTPISAARVSRRCFERGLIVETCGRGGQVLKILPPLTVDRTALLTGLDLLAESVREVAADGDVSTTRRTA
jgi:diaminobutyrate--2-oxoglutarate aminotransferase